MREGLTRISTSLLVGIICHPQSSIDRSMINQLTRTLVFLVCLDEEEGHATADPTP